MPSTKSRPARVDVPSANDSVGEEAAGDDATPATNRPVHDVRRVVIKVGTNTLCDPGGLPDPDLLDRLATEIHQLRSQGKQFLIVSSGAIGCGRSMMRLADIPQDVAQRQALAALGQYRMVSAWDDALNKHRTRAAQVLLTRHTFDRRGAYLNLRQCLETLLTMNAVPIVNENDTVSTIEIDDTFGDNDRLGALVAAKVEADLYIILSDVQGLYTKPPHVAGAEMLHRVPEINSEVLDMAGVKPGKGARGGMQSKLGACHDLVEAGVPVVIAYGREPGILRRILEGEELGTWFDAVGHQDGRKRWLMAARPQGKILVDAGAAQAIREGNHLLPAGVVGVQGQFPVETVVEIECEGELIARAISGFSSRDLERCVGLQSEEVRRLLDVDGPVNITRKGRVVLFEG